MPIDHLTQRYRRLIEPLDYRWSAVWSAWIVCHWPRTLPVNDVRQANDACRAGIVFG